MKIEIINNSKHDLPNYATSQSAEFYLAFALVLYGISALFKYFVPESLWVVLSFNTLLFAVYLWFIYKLEGVNLKGILKK